MGIVDLGSRLAALDLSPGISAGTLKALVSTY
jgi:hypothetical protein